MLVDHAFRLDKVYEKKCNFCFEWCEITEPLQAPLLCCLSCYQDFLVNGLQLQNTKGECFDLFL